MTREEKIALLTAENDIYRFCGRVEIEEVESPLFNLLVQDPSQGLKFGVMVVSSSYERNSSFQKYIETIHTTDLSIQENCLPIVLMSVNINARKSNFGIIVSWHREIATIYDKVSMRESNEKNWGIALDHLLSMNDAISVLSDYGITIKKTICARFNDFDVQFIYMRSFSDSYRMKSKEIKTEKERFERNLYGIPESEYPDDILDELIRKALSSRFTIDKYWSSSLLFTTELAELQLYKKNFSLHNILIEFKAATESYLCETPDKYVRIPINMAMSKFKIEDGKYDDLLSCCEDAGLVDQLREQKPSYHQLSEYLE